MNLIETMLRSHPHADLQRDGDYATVVQALTTCVEICTSCADACLGENGDTSRLRRCIRLNQDCADICAVTMRLVVRQTDTPSGVLHAQLHACIVACQACADECEKHASMQDHCRICAETCRHCQQRCNFLLGEISSSGVEEEAMNPSESPTLR